ncbi:hypothetical protein HK102_004325, partial [Quaeritorhiza haematococci]
VINEISPSTVAADLWKVLIQYIHQFKTFDQLFEFLLPFLLGTETLNWGNEIRQLTRDKEETVLLFGRRLQELNDMAPVDQKLSERDL